MDIKTIEKIVQRVEQSRLYQVTISEGKQTLTVTNRCSSVKDKSNIEQGDIRPINGNDLNTTDLNKTEFNKEKRNQNIQDVKATDICSPYVGYIQLAPDIGSKALVNVGDSVEIGQTVAYVNVLSKLLPICSDQQGMVSEVLVTSGDSVEYGQPILHLS